jgi:signal transduction histidine kinase
MAQASAAPLVTEGAVLGAVVVWHDITEEERLRAEGRRLEEQYREAQKMEAVGRLTAGIAHNFNNLLTVINGFAAFMQIELPADDPRQELAEKILHAGWRGADLVRQLMAFSSKSVVHTQILDMNALVVDMNRMLQGIVGDDIETHTALGAELWPVRAAPMQIEQIIANLVVNARDAMPEGGRLAVETANVTLDEDQAAAYLDARPGDYVLLRVSDTGAGMSDDVKAHLFEPFFTTKGPDKGTGLGLATVYGIVRQLGGHIGVDSREGLGAAFHIFLPRAAEDARPAGDWPAPPGLPSRSETILVVEHDDDLRELARRTLQRQGYQALAARDGQAALSLFADHPEPIHLLLTGVIMPGMSGPALADRLAAHHPDLKVLYMSGYGDVAVLPRHIPGREEAFLYKPFSPARLAARVRQVLDGRSLA